MLHTMADWTIDGHLTQVKPEIWRWNAASLIQMNSGRHWTQQIMQTWDLWPCWPHAAMEREGTED